MTVVVVIVVFFCFFVFFFLAVGCGYHNGGGERGW